MTTGHRRAWARILSTAVLGVALGIAVADAQPRGAPAVKSSPAAARPLADSEGKPADELQAAQKRLDTAGARVMAGSPNGRREVAEAIASQLGVPDKAVNELRARRMGYGEATLTLAVSQQLLKRERKLTQQQAIDKVVALRKSHGWAVVSRDLGLRPADIMADVKKAEAQLARLDGVRSARAERPRAARPAR